MAEPVEGPLRVSEALVIPADELWWRFSRSSGPGGQGVNTTDSRVELGGTPGTLWSAAGPSPHLWEWLTVRLAPALVDGSLVVSASEDRAQLRNRDTARRRLAQLVREALAPPPRPRRPTRPTRGSVERRLQTKAARSQTKAQRRSTTG